MRNHTSLKCVFCRKCIREGEEDRRLGSATIMIWTRVGPLSLILCGECARPGIDALLPEGSLFREAIKEKP